MSLYNDIILFQFLELEVFLVEEVDPSFYTMWIAMEQSPTSLNVTVMGSGIPTVTMVVVLELFVKVIIIFMSITILILILM